MNTFLGSLAHPQDPELALVEAALFVEQTFGIALDDADISTEALGTAEAIQRLVASRLGAR